MAQVTDIKEVENERNDNDNNIKFDKQDRDIDFSQLLKGMEPSSDDFEKRWEDALTVEEFLGEIKETIRNHFEKNYYNNF